MFCQFDCCRYVGRGRVGRSSGVAVAAVAIVAEYRGVIDGPCDVDANLPGCGRCRCCCGAVLGLGVVALGVSYPLMFVSVPPDWR